MLIDSHTHLYVDAFDEDRDDIVQKAINAGVEKMLLPNIDAASIGAVFKLSEKYPENCYPMMGLHPGNVKEDWKEQLAAIKKALYENKCIAVGEIGMDLYWDKTFQKQQVEAFKIQIEWAKDLQLPIVIHARDAFDEIFDILDEVNDETLTGVFHCFTGNKEQADKILSFGGFKLGIGGVVTYKNGGVPAAIEHLDLKHIILETDAPYLPPVPYRGKRNESSYVVHVAEKLVDVFGVSMEEIQKTTTENTIELFKL